MTEHRLATDITIIGGGGAGIAVGLEARRYDEAAGLSGFAAPLPVDYKRAFALINKEGARTAIVLEGPVFQQDRRRIAELAVQHRLPTMFTPRQYVEAGGLVAYGARRGLPKSRRARRPGRVLAVVPLPGDGPADGGRSSRQYMGRGNFRYEPATARRVEVDGVQL
jgi:hypothetical protein